MEIPDFRSYFLIWIKLARTVNEIHGDLLSTFPDSCPGLSTLQRWHTEFDKGVFALEKKTRLGHPRETRTEENDNPHMTTRQVAAEVSLPFTTVFRLLTEDLGIQNLLSVLVPHQLSEANKMHRVKCCQDLLKLFQDHGEDFLRSHLLVQDESCGGKSGRSPRGPGSRPPCETDNEEDDDSDWVHLQAEAADRNTMIEYLRTTGKRFLSLQKEQDPAERLSPHLGQCTEFLTRRDVEPVKQSPYSPDLNLCDRFLFRKLKHLLREDEFGDHEEPTIAVQRAMRRVSEDELYDQLRKLRGHCNDVNAVGGDYVY
ncbi:Transposase [Caligus rogercresseyi]|uniref:Transposase n=1 Tax=Caligus rogercresseyi TaxID=217165 RepID=A0A7T8KEJ5_CALRO|nr:Transposase [Caligus rogercresseyi]